MIAAVLRAYWPQLLVVVALLGAGAWCWNRIDAYGDARYAAGKADCQHAALAAAASAAVDMAKQHDQLEAASAQATTTMSQSLGTKLPANEAQSHASEAFIRVIYRDRPVPVELCSRPAGVQDELDKAVDAANVAATDHIQL